MAGTAWDGRPINVADMSRYSETDHGNSMAKTIVTLAGNGIEDILYWQLRFHVARDPAASLFAASEARDAFEPTYPSQVFNFLARALSDASDVEPTPGLRAGDLAEYRFLDEAYFSTLWAVGDKMVTVPVTLRSQFARMSNLTGAPIDPAIWDGRIGLVPIVVYWQTQSAANSQ
jgi:hypothetical protein